MKLTDRDENLGSGSTGGGNPSGCMKFTPCSPDVTCDCGYYPEDKGDEDKGGSGSGGGGSM